MKRSMSGERAHRRIVPTVLFVGALLATLIGCTEGERGIFATIAIEEKIKKNNLVENASLSGLVRAEFGGVEWYVAVAGTKVFARPVTGSDWDEISAPSSQLAQFVAGYDTNAPGGDERGTVEDVFVVYQGSSSSANAIYRLTDGFGWEVAYTPSGTYVDGLIGIDQYLFASTFDGNMHVWNGASLSGSPLGAPTASLSGFNDGVRDGVRYDNDGDGVFDDDFYLVGKSGLLARLDDALTTDAAAFTVTNDSPQPVGIGVAPYDTSIIAVTDLDGEVFISNSNTPESGPGAWDNAGTAGRPASDIVWIDVINNGNGAFLVSTRSDAIRNETGRGYFEAEISGSGGSYSLAFNNELGNNYEASDLAVASINSFRHFGNGVVFALTGGLGLWRTTYPPAGDPDWEWE